MKMRKSKFKSLNKLDRSYRNCATQTPSRAARTVAAATSTNTTTLTADDNSIPNSDTADIVSTNLFSRGNVTSVKTQQSQAQQQRTRCNCETVLDEENACHCSFAKKHKKKRTKRKRNYR